MSLIESGRREPTDDVLRVIAERLGSSVHFLRTGEDGEQVAHARLEPVVRATGHRQRRSGRGAGQAGRDRPRRARSRAGGRRRARDGGGARAAGRPRGRDRAARAARPRHPRRRVADRRGRRRERPDRRLPRGR
nr:hypothetical protein [Angustibacter aerolatus]